MNLWNVSASQRISSWSLHTADTEGGGACFCIPTHADRSSGSASSTTLHTKKKRIISPFLFYKKKRKENRWNASTVERGQVTTWPHLLSYLRLEMRRKWNILLAHDILQVAGGGLPGRRENGSRSSRPQASRRPRFFGRMEMIRN